MIPTNFESTKQIIRALVGRQLQQCEYRFCLYLIDQQFGYTEEKGVAGDSSSYGHIAKATGISPSSVKRAVKSLVERKIIIRELYATRYGNRYRFNAIDDWGSSNTDTGKGVYTHQAQAAPVDLPLPTVGPFPSTNPDTPVSSKTDTPPGISLNTGVVAELTPNSKASTVDNLSVENKSVNDSDASLTFFNNNDENDKNEGAEAIASYLRILKKSYPNLDVTKEFSLFREANPKIVDSKKIAQLFTEWCIGANEKKEDD
jgi:DNA-binding Lrp family transcriptional regulator